MIINKLSRFPGSAPSPQPCACRGLLLQGAIGRIIICFGRFATMLSSRVLANTKKSNLEFVVLVMRGFTFYQTFRRVGKEDTVTR